MADDCNWHGEGWYTARTRVHRDGAYTVEDWASPEQPLAFWAESPERLGEVNKGEELVINYHGAGVFPDEPVPVEDGILDGAQARVWRRVLAGELPVDQAPRAMRSKGGFKALRERVGMTQQDVADALDVRVRSVKRWEHESMPEYYAPDKAYELLESALETQRAAVAQCISVAEEQEREQGSDSSVVRITYYRDQAMCDQYGRDEGCFGMVNANARAVAQALERLGYTVEFRYPTEDAVPAPGSVC